MIVCQFIRPSVRMDQYGSHRTDFNEISYLKFSRKSIEKIQVSLKPDNGMKNCVCMYVCMHI